jgi:D-alanyl-D-alanine dipeptidase
MMNFVTLQMNRRLRIVLTLVFACVLMASSAAAQTPRYESLSRSLPKPAPAPTRWRGLVGEYGPDNGIVIVLEKDGKLVALFDRKDYRTLREISGNVFQFDVMKPPAGQYAIFKREPSGRATQLTIGPDPRTTKQSSARNVRLSSTVLSRRQIEPESGNQLHVQPLRPVRELMKEALAAQPPPEDGEFRRTDLVELTKLDPTVKLEIRYATTNNFLGTVFYSQPRAFMQRPAAEAVVRASVRLKVLGYGLLIHDAYRPWYVTKVFWDATPDDKKVFVADPAKGSRHNRGCAVDLTLYDLKTGKPIEMVSTYDETTARAYPDYPGGTSLQRWHRALLRAAMEAEGFTVYEAEWWHFDYQDWRKFRIGNLTFEQIK